MDMLAKRKRVPISGRVFEQTHDLLRVHAEKNGMSLAEIVGHVLDDYVVWMIEKLNAEGSVAKSKKKS